MKSFVLLLILFSLNKFCFAQSDSLDNEIIDYFEQLVDESAEDTEDDFLFDLLEELKNNPLDLNTASIQDLILIPFIDYNSAILIIEHRERFGYFFSVNEINAVRNLDKELIVKILPFIKVNIRTTDKPAQRENINLPQKKLFGINFRSRFIQDLQQRKGFLNNRYAGNKYKSYNRLQINYNSDYRLNILTEKDPGESSLTDFYSINFSAKKLLFFNHLIIGDYLIEFGQGLVLWRPYGFSKGSDAILPVMKRDRNIIPYTSADENQFFRGIAANISLNNFSVTTFYSSNLFDASLDTLSGKITSIPLDGFHRTDNELRRKNRGRKVFYGGRIDYTKLNNLKISFLYSHTLYNYPIATNRTGNRSNNKFNHYSLSYKYWWNNLTLFGETASDGMAIATINGFIINPARNLFITSSVRSYPNKYIALNSLGFGESSSTQNEVGFYSGIKWRTPIGLFNLYFDIFKFPSETFSNPLPTQGKEFLLDYTYKPVRNIETRLRYKNELKEITSIINEEKEIVLRDRKQLRFEIIYNLMKSLRIRSRFEINNFSINANSISENGLLYFADVRLLPFNNFQVSSRIIFFNIDSYNSRIYEYENDLTGVMTNMALFGEGIRWYLLLRYGIKNYSLSLKYAETFKPKEKTLSSGDNEIFNNIDNRISLQIDIRF